MNARTHGRDVYKRLKGITHKLIKACGGLEAAAEETRAGKSSLANYADSRDHTAAASMFAPIDVIADLEAAVGAPLVTKELARLAGYDLIPLEGAAAGTLAPLADHCHHSVLMGKATEAALAMDADNLRTADELAAYIATLVAARDHLQRVLDRARSEQIAAAVTPIRAA